MLRRTDRSNTSEVMGMKSRINRKLAWIPVTVLIFSFALPGAAAGSDSQDNWRFDGALYLWYSSMGGTTKTGQGVNVDASDLIEHLDHAFMGLVNARKKQWSILTDVMYFSANTEKAFTLPPSIPCTVRRIQLS